VALFPVLVGPNVCPAPDAVDLYKGQTRE